MKLRKTQDKLLTTASQGLYTETSEHSRIIYNDVPIEDFDGNFECAVVEFWDNENEKPLPELMVRVGAFRYPEPCKKPCAFWSRKVTIDTLRKYPLSSKSSAILDEEVYSAKKRLESLIVRVKWRDEHGIEGKVEKVDFIYRHGTEYTSGIFWRQILLDNGEVILVSSLRAIKIGQCYRFYREMNESDYGKVEPIN